MATHCRNEGVVQQVLAAATGALRCHADPALALASGGLLLAAAAEDAQPAFLACKPAAELAGQLLQVCFL